LQAGLPTLRFSHEFWLVFGVLRFFEDLRVFCYLGLFNAHFCYADCFFSNFMALLLFQFTAIANGIGCVFVKICSFWACFSDFPPCFFI